MKISKRLDGFLELAESRALGSDGFEVRLFRHVGLAAFHEVAEDAGEDERTDEDAVEDGPEDDGANGSGDDGEDDRIDGLRGAAIGQGFRDFLRERGKRCREEGENAEESGEEKAAHQQEGEEAHAEDAADVADQGLAVFEEDDGAFASGFGGVFVLAEDDPAQAAIAEIADEDLDGGIDRRGDGVANIAADGGADAVDAPADLAEDALDRVGHEEEGGERGETAPDFREAFFDDVVRKLVLVNAFGDHRDVGGLHAVGEEIAPQDARDDGEDQADDQTDDDVPRGDANERAACDQSAEDEEDREVNEELDARKNQGFSVNLKIGHVVFPFNDEAIL